MYRDGADPFGALLRRHRLAVGLTQEALAERAGLSARGIQDLERGGRRPLADTARRLAAALGLVGEERARFVAAGAPAPRDRALASELAAHADLPAEVTSFVGRRAELECLRLLLGTSRLLTLTGPGGVGKTRLAMRLAATVGDAFPDGVAFVSLADLTDPALVLPAAARAFGVQPGGRDLGATLAEWLRPRRLLLLLDNCEQVADAAPALGALLAACPKLTILATSRAPLRLAAEQEFPVPPLALPEEGTLPLEELRQIEAVALFAARARAVRPDFALSADNAAAVAAVCRRLDGLPLAIELAAARLRLLPPAALLGQLAHRLDALPVGPADLPERQRTLRATIAWSHDLLAPAERALFRRMGVFVGGFTLEMAGPVAAAAGPLGLTVLEGLDTLVRHSLVRQEEYDGEPRFWMLETVREFALERLALAGEVEATRDAHVEALLGRLDGERGPRWYPGSGSSPLRIAQLERERENLRLALAWCVERQDAVRGLRLARRATYLWWQAGPRAEGLAWHRRFLELASPAVPDWLRTQALWTAGFLADRLGERATARAYTSAGLALAEALHDEPMVERFLLTFVRLVAEDGDLAAAEVAAERELALARGMAFASGQGSALTWLGNLAYLRGDRAAAAARYREALAVRPPGTWEQRNLGYLALEAGGLEEAARFRESLAGTLSDRTNSAVLENLNAFAALARERDRWDRAATLLGAVDAGQERLGGALVEVVGQPEWERTMAAAREGLGEPGFAAAYAAGRAMTLEQAVDFALEDETSDE